MANVMVSLFLAKRLGEQPCLVSKKCNMWIQSLFVIQMYAFEKKIGVFVSLLTPGDYLQYFL